MNREFKNVDLIKEDNLEFSATRDDGFYFVVIKNRKYSFLSYNLEREEMIKLLTGKMRVLDLYGKDADIVINVGEPPEEPINIKEAIESVPCYNLYVNYSKFKKVDEFLEDL